jgi:hypothetical protein
MPEENSSSSSTPLSSLFPVGSSGSEKPSSTPAKEEDHSPVPVTDKSNSDDASASEKKPAKEKAQKKDKVPEDPNKDKDRSKDKKPAEKGADKSADEKAAEQSDSSDKKKPDASDADESASENPVEKRLRDTHAWANKVNQEKLQLQKQLETQQERIDILTKKLADPEYDPAQDPKYAGPTPEQIAETSLMAGKALASRDAAYREHGQERVDAIVGEFNRLFADNEAMQTAVRTAQNPIHQAMDIVEDFYFKNKYGFKPTQIKESIRKELEADLRKTIRSEILAEIREGKTLKDSSAKGLSDIRGGNGSESSKFKSEGAVTPLGNIFNTIK